MKYEIEYVLPNGLTEFETYRECRDVGQAFALCIKEHPGARMVGAVAEGSWGKGHGRTEYKPPKVQREPKKEPRGYRMPKRNERDGTMPFYDEVVSNGRK